MHDINKLNPDRLRGQQLYSLARQLIPGGTQLLSKRPEMYAPGQWPPYFERAAGVEVTDLDGRTFVDMTSMGLGASLLGYADPDVEAAVIDRLRRGSTTTLNCPEDVYLAQVLIGLHPWAEMARFCRGGGEAMAIAIRIARAHRKRDLVAFCGYHGWHDWYLAANLGADGDRLGSHLIAGLEPAGVPRGLAGTALPFTYNRIDELHAIVREHGHNLAAIVMEPTRSQPPEGGFLEKVRDISDKSGACLVFDEISVGFRLHHGGAHLRYGVMPDIAVFAKALANGIPMAAVLGRSAVMQAAQTSFISSTFWTEALGPAAAIAAIKKMKESSVHEHVAVIGKMCREGLTSLAERHGVPLKVGGHDALMTINFPLPAALAVQTLFTVRMLDHGFLAGAAFYPSLAHQPSHIMEYLDRADDVFREIRAAIDAGDVEAMIGGPIRHAGFTRLA